MYVKVETLDREDTFDNASIEYDDNWLIIKHEGNTFRYSAHTIIVVIESMEAIND